MGKGNEASGEKKKHPALKGIAIVVVVFIILCMVIPSGDSEDEKEEIVGVEMVEETQEEVQVPETEIEDREIQPIVTQEDKKTAASEVIYYKVGDTMSQVWEDDPQGGTIDLLITDMGLDHNKYDTDLLYVSVEITNNSSKEIWVGPNSDFNLYVDDYQYDTSSAETLREYLSFEADDALIGGIEVNPERKAKYTFRTVVTEEQVNGQTIELELYRDEIVLFKKDGEWLYDGAEAETMNFEGTELEGMEASDMKEGTYVSVESDAVITISNGLMSVQSSDGYDFEGEAIDKNRDGTYYVLHDGEYHEFIFMGDTGLSVSGDLGGWYDRID